MRSKSIVLLALALGCGLVASIGISQVMERRNQSNGTPGETEAVLVALTDVLPGEPITEQNVKIEEWPKSKVQPGVLTKPEEYENKRARQKIFAGEQLVAVKLIGANELKNASPEIPKGFRAVAVRVDAVSGSANMIVPGDRVDVLVFLSKNPAHNIQETQTKTILQDVKVFAVDANIQQDFDQEETAVAAKTISLLVTPAQAEKVTLASEMGSIRLVLRNSDDNQIVETGSTDTSEVLGYGGGSNRGAEVAKPAQPSPAATAMSGVASTTQTLLKYLQSRKANSTVAKPEEGPWNLTLIKGSIVEQMQISSDGFPTVVAESGEPAAAAPTQDETQEPAADEQDPLQEEPTTPSQDETATEPATAGPRVSLTQ